MNGENKRRGIERESDKAQESNGVGEFENVKKVVRKQRNV